MTDLDDDACYRAIQARDPRFDGRVFVGVETTGIYCRPVCPARTPKRENCRFFSSAAAAQEAGFRPCLRCRPEQSPPLASFRGTAGTVSRAVALIGEGALDGDGASVATLSERLGMGERQLRRLFDEHLGASPLAVAQCRRVLFAKQLIQETRLPMVEVALASGFGSVRRYNDTFRKLYGRPPRELRRLGAGQGSRGDAAAPSSVRLRLSYRPPFDWAAILAFVAARAISGMESVTANTYRRTIRLEETIGVVQIAHLERERSLLATIDFPQVRHLPAVVARIRQLFDLDADVETIVAHLSRDPLLVPLVRRRPGLRVPGGWDGFEIAVRAVLGQQVTVTAARALASRLTLAFGDRLPPDTADGTSLTRVFPTPRALASADLASVGLTPGSRVRALRGVAETAMRDPDLFRRGESLDDAVARFRAIPGVGAWTAQYIALRALREPDAFPATDVGLLRGATPARSPRITSAMLAERAKGWQPWRAYAAQHLWTHDGDRRADDDLRDAHDRATGSPSARRLA